MNWRTGLDKKELDENVALIFREQFRSELFQNFNHSNRFSTKWKQWIPRPILRNTTCSYFNVWRNYLEYISVNSKLADIFEIKTACYMDITSGGKSIRSSTFHNVKPHCAIQELFNSRHLQCKTIRHCQQSLSASNSAEVPYFTVCALVKHGTMNVIWAVGLRPTPLKKIFRSTKPNFGARKHPVNPPIPPNPTSGSHS